MAGPTFYGAVAMFRRDLTVFFREIVADALTTLAMPLTYLLVFGLGLSPFIRDILGLPYLAFVAPGLIAMAATTSAFDDAAWGIWFHRVVQGTIHEYRVNPITTYDIIIGKILSGFFKATVKGGIVGAILIPFTGYGFRWSGLPAFLLFLLLGSIFFSCIGNFVGTWLDEPELIGRFEAVVVIPIIFLSGLFYPLSSYPEAVRPVLRLLPTAAIFEGARRAILFGETDLASIGVLVAASAVAFVGAVFFFDRRLSE